LKAFELPPISTEFYEHLRKTFRPVEVEPETYRDKLMFEAGQQAVLEYMRRHVVSGTAILSDKREVHTDTHTNWKDRLFGWSKLSKKTT